MAAWAARNTWRRRKRSGTTRRCMCCWPPTPPAKASTCRDASRVQRVREEMERAEVRRLQPHYIESFFREAFRQLGGSARQREPRRYQVSHVPALIRNRDRLIGTSEPAFVCPGHPLLDAVIDLVLERHRDLLKRGAVLVDERDQGAPPRVLFSIEHAPAGRRRHPCRCAARRLEAGALRRARQRWRDAPSALRAVSRLPAAGRRRASGRRVPRTARVRLDRPGPGSISYWDHRAAQLALEGVRQDRRAPQLGRGAPAGGHLAAPVAEAARGTERDARISPRPPVVLGGLLIVPQGLVDRMTGRPEPSVVRPDDTLAVAARARARGRCAPASRRLPIEPLGGRLFTGRVIGGVSKPPRTGAAGAGGATVTTAIVATSCSFANADTRSLCRACCFARSLMPPQRLAQPRHRRAGRHQVGDTPVLHLLAPVLRRLALERCAPRLPAWVPGCRPPAGRRTGSTSCSTASSAATALIVSELSRLGRSLGQIVAILDGLAKAGVAFVALKENIRVEGKRDIQTKVMTTLFALFAEVERGT